jgi:hypothetical protein
LEVTPDVFGQIEQLEQEVVNARRQVLLVVRQASKGNTQPRLRSLSDRG